MNVQQAVGHAGAVTDPLNEIGIALGNIHGRRLPRQDATYNPRAAWGPCPALKCTKARNLSGGIVDLSGCPAFFPLPYEGRGKKGTVECQSVL
ncbi:hypothetical protein GCM10020258_29780 [Sphingomonas yabuuchiae]